MIAAKWVILGVLGGFVLSGCATYRLDLMEPGSITLDQARAKEKPAAEWTNPDGTITLEYDNRNYSSQNLMMDFDKDGVLAATREVLTEENMAKLHPGMRREEIKRILGNPRFIDHDGVTGGEIWSWPLDDVSEGDGSAKYVIEVHFHATVDGALFIRRGTYFR
jgi:hypothetical protein